MPGEAIHEVAIKNGLRELNPDLDFDMGARKEKWHPSIDKWQGIFLNGNHICAMDRGDIPEFNEYRTATRISRWVWDEDLGANIPIFTDCRGECLRVGWRTTFERLVRNGVPGVTWESLCNKFKIDYKRFDGDPAELNVE